jgi:hypothetical protein
MGLTSSDREPPPASEPKKGERRKLLLLLISEVGEMSYLISLRGVAWNFLSFSCCSRAGVRGFSGLLFFSADPESGMNWSGIIGEK